MFSDISECCVLNEMLCCSDQDIDIHVGTLSCPFLYDLNRCFSLNLFSRFHPSEKASRMIGSFTYLLLQRPFI